MKIEYIDPFISAIKKVIGTMAFVDSIPGNPFIKKANDFSSPGDISAVIELIGKNKGSLAISFPKNSVLLIAKQVFEEEYKEINEEILDMVGEFINMISGETRKGLAKLGFHFSAGIPVTMQEKNHEIRHFASSRIVSVPFQTRFGDYYAEACFELNIT